MIFNIEVNNVVIKAEKGETILSALNRNGIFVPTLCHMKGFAFTGACRLCVVEVEGKENLLPACSHPVEEWMRIKTHSDRVIKARQTIVELLLANHPDDCLYCVRNMNCELQKLAKQLNISERRFFGNKNEYNIDLSSVSIVRDPAKCILCGRCVRVCEEVMGVSAIDFTGRGNKTVIHTAFKKGLNVSTCVACGQCILVCPTGALYEKNYFFQISEAINNPEKKVVVQYAPSISVSLAEEFDIKPGKDITGILNAALRKIGFNKIFDTSFGADLTIMEESVEFIDRLEIGDNLPMFSSCCPAWVKYLEEYYPEFIPRLSTCKSPQQMLGAVVKNVYSKQENWKPEHIFSVSIMPCTAKKFEAQRDEMTHKGISDIDAVITTRELAQFIRIHGIDMNNIEPEPADNPMGTRSSAGKLFAVTGGVTESMLRTVYFKMTGKEMDSVKVSELRGCRKRKETKVNINGSEFGFAIVCGLSNVKPLLEEIKAGRDDLHFIEIMACPNGCVGGGGQPIGADEKDVKARGKAIYEIDEKEMIKVAHKNPQLAELYEKYLGSPGSEKCKQLLHTHYLKRVIE